MEDEILQLAALVAAFVGVIRRLGLKEKWTHVVALIVAAIFVLIPNQVRD